MKIYQLHEYYGMYEDYTDDIIGSFLRKERAVEEKAKAETKEQELIAKHNKCRECPYAYEDFEDMDNLLDIIPDYCDEVEVGYSSWGAYCNNEYTKYDTHKFEIVEVEVEE